ncbi:MAG TPA: hypothetical protein VF614_17470, partial [Chthoniobacteraceae bacterium]
EKTLTPAEAERWRTVVAEREQETEKLIKDHLDGRAAQMRETFRQQVAARTAEIKRLLELTPERAKQIDAVVEKALEQSMAKWAEFTREQLAPFVAENREAFLKQKNFYFGTPDEASPTQQPAWKEGLAAHLSAEESQRLKQIAEERRARQRRHLAEILISELDEHVAFTAAQRESIRPTLETLLEKSPLLAAGENPEQRRNVDDIALLTAAGQADEQLMRKVLDERQWKRWQALCSDEIASRTARRQGNRKAELPAGFPVNHVAEPEDCDGVRSDFLHERVGKTRQQLLQKMTLKVEDACRVAALPPESRERLETAARGATELALVDNKTSLESMVRQQTRNAVPENIHVRLAGIQDYQFQNSERADAEKHAVWEAAVTAELNEAQRTAWKGEVEARQTARAKAITTLITAEIDHLTALSSEQWEKLHGRLTEILDDYATEIGTYLSHSYGPWYYQSYYRFTPVHGIPEAEMKSILTKEQWQVLTGSEGFSNGASYWESIKRQNENRKKNAKKK